MITTTARVPLFRPEAEGRGRIYTPFCPGLGGPVTCDVPFAGPCVVGRTPGLVCWTPGLALEHFHVFLARCPFALSTLNSPSHDPPNYLPPMPFFSSATRDLALRSFLHIVFFVSRSHISSRFVQPVLSSFCSRSLALERRSQSCTSKDVHCYSSGSTRSTLFYIFTCRNVYDGC